LLPQHDTPVDASAHVVKPDLPATTLVTPVSPGTVVCPAMPPTVGMRA
jgi:hypothetical protein